jgi:hypothetical protein
MYQKLKDMINGSVSRAKRSLGQRRSKRRKKTRASRASQKRNIPVQLRPWRNALQQARENDVSSFRFNNRSYRKSSKKNSW